MRTTRKREYPAATPNILDPLVFHHQCEKLRDPRQSGPGLKLMCLRRFYTLAQNSAASTVTTSYSGKLTTQQL